MFKSYKKRNGRKRGKKTKERGKNFCYFCNSAKSEGTLGTAFTGVKFSWILLSSILFLWVSSVDQSAYEEDAPVWSRRVCINCRPFLIVLSWRSPKCCLQSLPWIRPIYDDIASGKRYVDLVSVWTTKQTKQIRSRWWTIWSLDRQTYRQCRINPSWGLGQRLSSGPIFLPCGHCRSNHKPHHQGPDKCIFNA